MAAVLLIIGAVLAVGGATFLHPAAGVAVAGFLLVAAGSDLSRRP